MFDEDGIRDLERRAADCWPPFAEADLEGWRLRFAEGASRRANSVLALDETGTSSTAARVNAAEAYYKQRAIPCRFQISGGVQPRGLDAELERRGYAIEARSLVMTAPLSKVLENTAPTSPAAMLGKQVRLFSGPSAAWFQVYSDGLKVGRERGLRCRLAEGLPAPRAYAVLDSGPEPAAVGAAVLSGSWMLILCMATRRRYRNRGLAVRVLSALAGWAVTGNEGGAGNAFLQVEADNSPALGLYHKAGFQPAHTYYYRTQPSETGQAGGGING